MSVEIIPAFDHLAEIRDLFSEYTDMLVSGDPSFREYLTLQNYDSELDRPHEKYGPPGGRLLLALWDGIPAGCAALRKLDTQSCEMKRLYVRPEFRGRRIGRMLVQRILSDAREIGYRRMLLDTLPFLDRAIQMYRNAGFYEIPGYNDSPMSTSIYMRLDL